LIRFGLSLAMAAHGSDLPGVTTARMLEQMMEGYHAPLDDAVEASDLSDHRRATDNSDQQAILAIVFRGTARHPATVRHGAIAQACHIASGAG
jgi:uncharacterized protein (DUF2252 family)